VYMCVCVTTVGVCCGVFIVLECVTVCWNVLQCVGMCYSVLECVAVCCRPVHSVSRE